MGKKESNWKRLFGTEKRAAKTAEQMVESCHSLDCRGKKCPLYSICEAPSTKKYEKWMGEER